MKVIITESQMNNTIEKLIRSVNKDVVSVNFDVKKQAVIDGKKGISYYDKTIITVVLDPHDILGGNIHHVVSTLYIPLRKEIQKALSRFMNIDTTKFMSPYDIEYYVLGTTRV
jgi:hypothetical protein